jgi:hypothetical protein
MKQTIHFAIKHVASRSQYLSRQALACCPPCITPCSWVPRRDGRPFGVCAHLHASNSHTCEGRFLSSCLEGPCRVATVVGQICTANLMSFCCACRSSMNYLSRTSAPLARRASTSCTAALKQRKLLNFGELALSPTYTVGERVFIVFIAL